MKAEDLLGYMSAMQTVAHASEAPCKQTRGATSEPLSSFASWRLGDAESGTKHFASFWLGKQCVACDGRISGRLREAIENVPAFCTTSASRRTALNNGNACDPDDRFSTREQLTSLQKHALHVTRHQQSGAFASPRPKRDRPQTSRPRRLEERCRTPRWQALPCPSSYSRPPLST